MNSLNSTAVILVGLGSLFYLLSSNNKKEGFRHFRQQAQPGFNANLSPRSDNIGVQQGGQLGFNQSPSLQMGGVPPTAVPLNGNPNYNTLGAISSPGDKLLLNRGNFLTNEQVQKIVGSGTPDYQQNQLPNPDMRYAAGLDPTNPNNYIYDRTLFSRLKRRYTNDVDYFRGDIDVTPEYRGWFDIRRPSDVDVVKGYFDRYIDIEQDTAIRDAIFDRNTPMSEKQMRMVNPFGDVDRLVNSDV
jgi:hypothetical protein